MSKNSRPCMCWDYKWVMCAKNTNSTLQPFVLLLLRLWGKGGVTARKSILCLTYSHSEQPKQAWQFWKDFFNKSIIWKIFEGEMLTRSQTATLLQIFCKISLYSQVIFKSMKVADGTFLRNSECEWVNPFIPGHLNISASSGYMTLLQLTYKWNFHLKNTWRKVVDSLLVKISNTNVYQNLVFSQRYGVNCQTVSNPAGTKGLFSNGNSD